MSRRTNANKKKRSFRLQVKKVFLTYPKCNVSPQLVMEKIKEDLGDKLEFAVVAKEKHKDGDLHLHCLINLKKKLTFGNKRLDAYAGQHGNYQAARVLKDVLKYITKDNEFISWNINVEEWLKLADAKKNTKSNKVAILIKDGATLKELNDLEPGYVMMNLQKIKAYQNLLRIMELENKFKFWKFTKAQNESEKKIVEWFSLNVLRDRAWTQPALYIHGSTQKGKTTFIRSLKDYFKMYFVPMDEDFYDAYDDKYEICVFEEFRSQKRIQWLNNFIDANDVTLRKKGSQAIRRKCTPCIFLSNYKIDECFSKVAVDRPDVMETLTRRLEIVEVDEFISLKPVPEAPKINLFEKYLAENKKDERQITAI